MKTQLTPLFIVFVFGLFAVAFAAGDHDPKHETSENYNEHRAQSGPEQHDDHGHLAAYAKQGAHAHGGENTSHIDDIIAKQAGIVTSTAVSQELHQTITVYGSIVSAPEQLSHVRARFEGMVKSVEVTLGDRVKSGDVLAEVESNESLKAYTIHAPISGRIVQRHANTGEVTGDQILFSIANFDTVWAELRVYPAQLRAVTEGQVVHILTSHNSVESTVEHIMPSMTTPYFVARVKLANNNHALSPGLMVEARVETGRFSVPLAIVKDAVQTLGGRPGVFVKEGDHYRFRPLVLGESDDRYYEVLDGLKPGSEYVSVNSYLVRADIEKSEAEHEH